MIIEIRPERYCDVCNAGDGHKLATTLLHLGVPYLDALAVVTVLAAAHGAPEDEARRIVDHVYEEEDDAPQGKLSVAAAFNRYTEAIKEHCTPDLALHRSGLREALDRIVWEDR